MFHKSPHIGHCSYALHTFQVLFRSAKNQGHFT